MLAGPPQSRPPLAETTPTAETTAGRGTYRNHLAGGLGMNHKRGKYLPLSPSALILRSLNWLSDLVDLW